MVVWFDHGLNQVIDFWLQDLNQVLDLQHLLIVAREVQERVGDRLMARNRHQRRARRPRESRAALRHGFRAGVDRRRLRMGLDEQESAIDLVLRWALQDRLHRVIKWSDVENTAIDEIGRGRLRLFENVLCESGLDEDLSILG
jgi:hypothetical protein